MGDSLDGEGAAHLSSLSPHKVPMLPRIVSSATGIVGTGTIFPCVTFMHTVLSVKSGGHLLSLSPYKVPALPGIVSSTRPPLAIYLGPVYACIESFTDLMSLISGV